MTYLDKFKQDHPDWRVTRFGGVPVNCPRYYGYPFKGECKRDRPGPIGNPCYDCWHSEYPEQEAESAEPMTVKQVKIFPGADDGTYGSLETRINEFLKTVPAEKVMDIRVTETDGKFTVTVVYEDIYGGK